MKLIRTNKKYFELKIIKKYIKNITVFLLTLIIITFLPTKLAQTVSLSEKTITEKIDIYLEKAIKDWQIPGLAVGIVADDQIVYLRSFSDDQSITPDTPFILGSITKSFTSMAIMQLVDQGKISLDEPVKTYLPWFKLADDRANNQLTLRHLLYHTSGLSMQTDIDYLKLEDTDHDLLALRKYVESLSTAKPMSAIGTKFNYANTNYAILGMIIEEVTGMFYSDYIEKNIFQPLQMNNSYTSQIAAENADIPLAKGYRFWLNKPVETTSVYSRQNIASGYLISSARDMCNYLMLHLNNGKFGKKSLVSTEKMRELHQPKIHAWGAGFYAMGWVNDRIKDTAIEYHGGELVNFSSNITLVPQKKWGIIILNNIFPGVIGDPIRKLYVGIIHILLGEQPPILEVDLGSKLLVFGLPSFLILQIIGFALSLMAINRGKIKQSKLCWLSLTRYIIYPLFFDSIIAIGLLIYLPHAVKASFPLMLFAQPDLAYIVLFSGILALCSLIRTSWTTATSIVPN